MKKQKLGLLIYPHVLGFVKSVTTQLGVANGDQVAQKVTGMILSVEIEQLMRTCSSYETLCFKANEALQTLLQRPA